MKVVILAGGIGSRLCAETENKPKAMVEIGSLPIIWHIMTRYSHFGFTEFVVALGYKADYITDWMKNNSLAKNVIVNTNPDAIDDSPNQKENNWKVHLIDTGLNTQTGGRIKRLESLLADESFMLAYCDGLSDVNFNSLLKFHKSHGKIATVTAVRPQSRFGHLVLNGNNVTKFIEKPPLEWVNGAFYVFESEIFDYLKDDDTRLAKESLETLAQNGQLKAFCHDGFWQCMDTVAEKVLLEKIWATGKAPWKIK